MQIKFVLALLSALSVGFLALNGYLIASSPDMLHKFAFGASFVVWAVVLLGCLKVSEAPDEDDNCNCQDDE